jgi:hypothetical protein
VFAGFQYLAEVTRRVRLESDKVGQGRSKSERDEHEIARSAQRQLQLQYDDGADQRPGFAFGVGIRGLCIHFCQYTLFYFS